MKATARRFESITYMNILLQSSYRQAVKGELLEWFRFVVSLCFNQMDEFFSLEWSLGNSGI